MKKGKGYYSVEGNYKFGNKIVFEERKYLKASSFEEAIKMAREDGNVSSGMVLFNFNDIIKCNSESISLGKLALMTLSKN